VEGRPLYTEEIEAKFQRNPLSKMDIYRTEPHGEWHTGIIFSFAAPP